jgi:hypothetical protein
MCIGIGLLCKVEDTELRIVVGQFEGNSEHFFKIFGLMGNLGF